MFIRVNWAKSGAPKAWMYRSGTTPLPVLPDSPVPAGVDYNMWLGPAPKQPFNKNRFHYEFRWFWDYAGGLMTDWGVHLIDMVLLGMKAEVPKSVVATGGKYGVPDRCTRNAGPVIGRLRLWRFSNDMGTPHGYGQRTLWFATWHCFYG